MSGQSHFSELLSPGGPGALHGHLRTAAHRSGLGHELPFAAECLGVTKSPSVHGGTIPPGPPPPGRLDVPDQIESVLCFLQRKKNAFLIEDKGFTGNSLSMSSHLTTTYYLELWGHGTPSQRRAPLCLRGTFPLCSSRTKQKDISSGLQQRMFLYKIH